MESARVRRLSGLEEIAGLYDGFILDLWGVVHDGLRPFPDTIPTLKKLKAAKSKVWLLSNAPRRSYVVVAKLREMGIGEDLYDGILTSGEATWRALRDKYLSEWGRRCFHLGSSARDSSVYEGLDVELVNAPGAGIASDYAADFVLNTGVHDFSDTAAKYEVTLRRCAERGLPMICANPDRAVHVGDRLVVCAGTLADMYERMKGHVVYFGKPHRAVYSACLAALGAKRALAVGDSMLTDIAGATAAGIDSVLITSGLHKDELAPLLSGGREHNFLAQYPYQPTYMAGRLCW